MMKLLMLPPLLLMLLIAANSPQPFPDFEVINFVTELDPGMSAQSSRKRSTSPSSRELAARVELLLIESDTDNEAEVVCNLKFEDHAMTDECNPHNEICHEVSAPHLHQDPRAAEMVTTLVDGSIDIVKYCMLCQEADRTGDHTEAVRFADNVPESAWHILVGTNNEREPPPIKERRKKVLKDDIELDVDIKKAFSHACIRHS